MGDEKSPRGHAHVFVLLPRHVLWRVSEFLFLLLVLVQDSTLISIPNILSNTLLADRLLNVFTRLVRFHRLRDVNAHAASFEKASAFDALTGGSQ